MREVERLIERDSHGALQRQTRGFSGFPHPLKPCAAGLTGNLIRRNDERNGRRIRAERAAQSIENTHEIGTISPRESAAVRGIRFRVRPMPRRWQDVHGEPARRCPARERIQNRPIGCRNKRPDKNNGSCRVRGLKGQGTQIVYSSMSDSSPSRCQRWEW